MSAFVDLPAPLPWSPVEEAVLAEAYGVSPAAALEALPHRTKAALHIRAHKLGLTTRRPNGWEHLTAAAQRLGEDRTTLEGILVWAGVTIRRESNGWKLVRPVEVDAAVARWLETEPVQVAARRHGVSGTSLRRRLARLGLVAGGHGKPLRVTEEQVRAALALTRYGNGRTALQG